LWFRACCFSSSFFAQVACSVDALMIQLGLLLEIVLTIRALSTNSPSGSFTPPASPRVASASPPKKESVAGLDFWTEKATASSIAPVDLAPPMSPSMGGGGGSGISKLKRFAKGLRRENEEVAAIPASSKSSVKLGEEALPKRGTLNMLIEGVTHPRFYQQEYAAAFFATMHSFSSGATVLKKLLERFDCPSWEPEADAIRSRVGLVLKLWLETQVQIRCFRFFFFFFFFF
jgi:hypothetical protein